MDIDLKTIIAEYSIDIEKLGNLLFPTLQYKNSALARIIRGDASLKSNQIYKLAQMLGCPIDSLYSKKGYKVQCNKNIMSFKKDSFEAILNKSTMHVIIFSDDEPIYQEVILQNAISVDDFYDVIEKVITKIK